MVADRLRNYKRNRERMDTVFSKLNANKRQFAIIVKCGTGLIKLLTVALRQKAPELLSNLMDTMGVVLTMHPLTAAEKSEAVVLLQTGSPKRLAEAGQAEPLAQSNR